MFGAVPAGTVPAGTTGFAAPARNLLDVPDIDDSVFLFELKPAGAAGAPAYVPLTAGTFPAGTLPYPMPLPPEVPLYFSDRDWTNRQNNPPVLDFDLTRLPLDSRLTFTRASNGWYFDSSGTLRLAAANAPRVDYDPWSGSVRGLLMEPAATNAVRTTDHTGAVVGDGGDPFGTFPDHWDFGWFGAAVTFSITGKGTEYGLKYFDTRVQVTGTANDQAAYIFPEANDYIAAVKDETWTYWMLARIVGGSMANITDLRLGVDEFSAAHVNLTSSLSSVLAPLLSNAPRQVSATRTLTENTTANVRPFFSVHYGNGAVVDITIRFYHSQVEKSPFPTSLIPTGGYTRAADQLTAPLGTDWFSPAAGSMMAEFMPYALSASLAQSVLSFDDGTNNERINLRYSGSTLAYRVIDGGATQADLTLGTGQAAMIIRRAAMSYAASDFAALLTDGTMLADGAGTLPTPTTLCLGNRASGSDQLCGYLRRFSYWPVKLPDVRLAECAPLADWPPAFAAANDANVNQHYEGRALLPQIEQSLPLPPEGNHRAGLTLGELVIDNTDGLYDTLARTVGIDGRAVAIKRLPQRGARYADAVPVFTGVGQDWVASGNQLRIALRDNSRLLEVPFQALYGGMGGADGTVDSAGQPIMQCYGLCRNVAPRLIDPGKLIYQLHDRAIAGVDAVRVRGATVSAGTTQASYAALDAATVSAGTFQAALTATGSYIRLGSNPDGPVTVDLRGDALGGYVADTAGIMRRLLLRVLMSDQLAPASFSSLTTQLAAAIGLVLNDTMSLAGAVTIVLAGTYTYLTDQTDGRLAVGRLGLPYAGASLAITQENLIGEPMRAPLPEAIAPCLWRVRVGYRRNWLPMSDSDVVPYPTLTETQRQELKETERLVISADVTRRSWHPAAGDAVLHSLFDSQADAQALADFLLAMFAPARELWELPLANTGHGIALNDNISVAWPRGGLADGKNLRVVGRTVSSNKVSLLGFG